MSKLIFMLGLITIGLVKMGDTAGSSSAGSPAPVFCYSNSACDESSPEWGGVCKTGKNQSPIDFPVTIVPLGLALISSLKNPIPFHPLTHSGYVCPNFDTVDNGHTVQISCPSTTSTLTGYGLKGVYVFAQAHFHWGNLGTGGSEHTIGGKHFTGEIHLVHYLQSYGSVAAAAASGDPAAIAVVARFIQVTPLGTPEGDAAMFPIVSHLPGKYSPNATHVNQAINLNPFMPKTGEMVFRYDGSLTTPGCNEAVVWTVIEQPLQMAALEAIPFSTVKDEDGERLAKNYRATKPLNGRHVEAFKVVA